MKDFDVLSRTAALVADFGLGLSLPEQKFLQDMVFGILCSRSSLLSEIARAITGDGNVKTIHRRLDLNLGRYDLSRPYERAQQHLLKKIDEAHLFIFDPSEVVKPFGKKMEGLTLVRDASEKPRRFKDPKTKKFVEESVVLKPGYPLRIAIAISPAGDVLPVELSLYSPASESFISRNDEYVQVLDTLLHRTGFAPTLILDREFDAFAFIRHLCLLRQKFVIRLKDTRKFRVPGTFYLSSDDSYSRKEMAEKYGFLETKSVVSYGADSQRQPILISIRAARVELLSEQKKKEVIRDQGELDALTLVRVQILKKADATPTLYLLTSTRPSTEPELERVALSYFARWNVEEYIRFLKQHFSLEQFLVRDLGRMKNLVHAVYCATVAMHLLTDRETVRGARTHYHLLKQSLDVSYADRFKDFFLYSYGRALGNLVQQNRSLFLPLNDRLKNSDSEATQQLNFFDN